MQAKGDAVMGEGLPDSYFGAVRRGWSLRCPRCGQGKLFRGLLRMEQSCSACGFRFERAPGYFLGSTYINYGITAAVTTFTYVVSRFGFRVSNSILLPLLLGFCAIFPLVFFRYARSLWLSLDCYFDRTGAEEAAYGEVRDGLDRKD